jgi:hypothetical protein
MNITKLIDAEIVKDINLDAPRTYLGASSLGTVCDAKLWYQYTLSRPVKDPRVLKIFRMGHILEAEHIKYMRMAGIIVHNEDKEGNQFGFTDGIIAGHVDGFIETDDENYLLEIKTYNDSRFKTLVKETVQQSDPIYYTQCQVYMHYFGLTKCIFYAINKNTCAVHEEIINYDPIEANWAINRGKQIGVMNGRPDRKYEHKSSFGCKFCDYRKECWTDTN